MGLSSRKKQRGGETRNVDTIISSEAVFEGVLQTQNSICIEGVFKGQLECKGQVILNKTGCLEANVVAEYVTINGKVTGNITALKQLDVGPTGAVHGDVKAASVTIQKGGVLDGTCKMLSEGDAAKAHVSVTPCEVQQSKDAVEIAKNGKGSPEHENGALQKG
jgi:cytoskeletal protein CcmA (bactofilin family)